MSNDTTRRYRIPGTAAYYARPVGDVGLAREISNEDGTILGYVDAVASGWDVSTPDGHTISIGKTIAEAARLLDRHAGGQPAPAAQQTPSVDLDLPRHDTQAVERTADAIGRAVTAAIQSFARDLAADLRTTADHCDVEQRRIADTAVLGGYTATAQVAATQAHTYRDAASRALRRAGVPE